MPSPRPLRSGIDYQLRYSAWRLILIATGADSSLPNASRFRVEWPLRDDDGRDVWSDFVIEGRAGEVLEVVECREHSRYIPLDSIESFLRNVQRIRTGASATALFRYASTAWILRDGRDLTDAATRTRVVEKIDPTLVPIADSVQWDLRLDSKGGLFARSIFELTDRVADARWAYSSLYARLAAMLGDRLPGADPLVRDAMRDTQIEIFGTRAAYRSGGPSVSSEDAIDVDELRRRLTAARRSPVAQITTDVFATLRRDMYKEEGVSLEEVFIEQSARYETGGNGMVSVRSTGVIAAMFDWLSDVRELRAPEEPLLLIGPFGSGKSTALRAFAARLLERSLNVVPIPVPLRDLAKVADPSRFDDEVRQYVRAKWDLDVKDAKDAHYCLLCDGFDELNLYYSRDGGGWAEKVYARLAVLTRERNVSVVISSRPLQLLDVTSRGSVAERAPRVIIEDLTPEQVEQWCVLYRKAANIDDSFSWSFLEQRKLVSIARTPIILYMIARIYATSPDMLQKRSYTLGEIYRIFIDWTAKGGYLKDEEKHRVPSNYREILQEIAWHLSQAEGGLLSEQDLLARLRDTFGPTIEGLPVERNLLVAHMLQPVTNAREDVLVEFKHQSFRDYLVSERIMRVILSVSDVFQVVDRLTGRPGNQATFSFLADRLGASAVDDQQLLLGTESLDFTAGGDDKLSVSIDSADSIAADGYQLLLRTEGADDVEQQWKSLPANATSPASVASLTVLMFFLRMRALAHLHSRTSADSSSDIRTFRRLLNFLYAFDSSADVQISRDTLLRNLNGLRFHSGNLSGMTLASPSWDDVHLRSCEAARLVLEVDNISNSSFTSCGFEHASLVISGTSQLRISECDLAHASFRLGSDAHPCREIRLDRSDLESCRFERLYVEHGSFAGNNWDQAAVDEGVLMNCTLDDQAFAFFRLKMVTLIDCRSPALRKWRDTSEWSVFTAELSDTTDADHEKKVARFMKIALPESAAAIEKQVIGGILRIKATPEFVIDFIRKARSLSLPNDAMRFLMLVHNEADAEKCRAFIREAAMKKRTREANVWDMGDLVEAAFDSVARSLDVVLQVAAPTRAAAPPFSYRFVEFVGGREPPWPALSTPSPGLFEILARAGRRLIVLTGDEQSTVARKLAEARGWALISGSTINPDVALPQDLLRIALSLAVPRADEEQALRLSIIDSISKTLVGDQNFTLVVYDLDPRLLRPVLRVFREAKARLVISLQCTDVVDDIKAELRTWSEKVATIHRLTVVALDLAAEHGPVGDLDDQLVSRSDA